MSESELGPARAFARDLFKSRIEILAGARVLSPELAPVVSRALVPESVDSNQKSKYPPDHFQNPPQIQCVLFSSPPSQDLVAHIQW